MQSIEGTWIVYKTPAVFNKEGGNSLKYFFNIPAREQSSWIGDSKYQINEEQFKYLQKAVLMTQSLHKDDKVYRLQFTSNNTFIIQ